MKRWQWWMLACTMGLFSYDGARGQSAADLRLAAANDPLFKAQGGRLNSDSWTFYFDRVPNAMVMPFENGLLVRSADLYTPEQYLEKRVTILRRVAQAIGCLQFPESWGMNLSAGTGFTSAGAEGSTKVSVDLSRTLQQVSPPTGPGPCSNTVGSQVWARDLEGHYYLCAKQTPGDDFQWGQVELKFTWTK